MTFLVLFSFFLRLVSVTFPFCFIYITKVGGHFDFVTDILLCFIFLQFFFTL